MIYIVFNISWPAPPIHDQQYFKKKMRKFPVVPRDIKCFNRIPDSTVVFKFWGWAGLQKMQKAKNAGVLCVCVFLPCVFVFVAGVFVVCALFTHDFSPRFFFLFLYSCHRFRYILLVVVLPIC